MDDPPSIMPPAQTPIPPVIASAGGVTPAPMLWRIIALALDTSLAGFAAWVILSRIVLPQHHPDAANIMHKQWQAIETAMQSAPTSGTLTNFAFDDEAVNIVTDISKTFFLTLLAYFFASEMALGGSTLGKRTFGLRAASWSTGAPPSFLESFCRCLFKVASFFLFFPVPILLVINTIPVFFQPTRRAGHDRLASTIVTSDAPPPRPKHADEEWS